MKETLTVPTLNSADFPPAVRAYWDSAPAQFKVPAILTAIDCYCALATRLRFKYTYDLDLHALLLQVLVVAEAASGKSFTRPIVKTIMQPLKLRDQEMKRIEQAYQDLKKTSSKNKQLPEEPVTDVRCLQTITKAKLVKRADMFIRKYGEPLAFWFYNEELATMTESNKRAFADLRTMDRLAYDLGAEYGSDTLSDASYNADVDVIYCSLFCATENALKEYMDKRSIEGGNCTRKVLTDLGDLMGEDAPRFRPLTDGEQTEINDTVQHLMNLTYAPDGRLQPVHVVPMEWMDYHVRRWCSEQRQLVLKTGSRARNCFYKRASVSAARMACLLYHLWGEDATRQKHVARFYRFMATYIVDGLLSRWGRQYEQMHKTDENDDCVKVSLYDQLPDQFSRDQLRELIVKLDLSTPARVFISKWKSAKLIYASKENKDIYVKNY
ncbi:MAG: hypothetical protein PUB62_01065 [Prevotellaceae bacterium]|nr:hypothetical protein [Prevotellaceae bacterium]